MIILTVFLCGGLAVLLWMMLKFPKKVGIKISTKNCTDGMRICPPTWHLISETCFFSSEDEVTWAEGQRSCRVFFGSLAMLDKNSDMKHLYSYLKNSTFWIGQRKFASSSIWKWIDGSDVIDLLRVNGTGNCAFISKSGMQSTSCEGKRRYLCSRRSECA